MKKTKKYLLIISVLFYLTSLLTSCRQVDITDDETYFETEYFMCYYLIDDDVKTLCVGGLTKKGRKLKELAIPSEINGEKVHKFGYYKGENYFLDADFEKIFIPESVRIGKYNLLDGLEVKVMLITIPIGLKRLFNSSYGQGQRYAPAALCENEEIVDYSYIAPANVSFMNNYDEDINYGYHWIDNIEEGFRIITIPPEPTREGYTFFGWFAEPECINEWDFDENKKGNTDLILYAKWIEN